jgi:hypothetical protein
MFGSMMMEVESRTVRRPAEENRASTPPATDSKAADTGPDEEDVKQLRERLRTAERAYCGYLAELRQGDVEPVEDWSTWYAEYLLGPR